MNLYDFFSNKKINLTENLVSASDIEKQVINENLHKWFKEKWVRFGPDGKIRGDCARGDDSEGKPKCLPQSKAHSLGKKGRASAASRKRREDPNPERRGAAINVATKKESISEEAFYEKLIMLEYKLAEAGGKGAAMGTNQSARDTRADLRATSVNPPTTRSTTPSNSQPVPTASTARAERERAEQNARDANAAARETPSDRAARIAAADARRQAEIARATELTANRQSATSRTPSGSAPATTAAAATSARSSATTTQTSAPSSGTRRGAMPRAGTPGAYYVANEPTPTPPAPRPPGTTASGVVRPAPTTGVSTDLPSKLSGGDSDNDYSRASELGNLPLPSSAVVTSPMSRTTPSDNRPAVQATSLPPVGREPSSVTKPTDDQLAAAADLATGGYSGGKKTEPTAPTTPPPSSYTIQRGDTLSQIAKKFGTTTQELMRLNPDIKDPNKIVAGKPLNTPGVTPYPSDSGIRVGQAPTIDDETRERARLSVAPDQSDAETARLSRTGTNTGSSQTVSSEKPTNDQDDIKQNLTPEQLKYAGNGDLSRPETGSTRIIMNMPLPNPEEMAKAIGTAESQKNPDLSFGDTVRNDKIVSLVKANKGPNAGQPLLTAEEWSKRNLGASKKLSDMTVAEVMDFQRYREENHTNANAVGAYQFIGGTLRDLIKQSGIDPRTTKFDQTTQNILFHKLTEQNGLTLKKNGIVPDTVNLYMAHAVGPGGAVDVYNDLRKNPNKTVIDSVMDGWKRRNPNDSRDPRKVEAAKKRYLDGNPHFEAMPIKDYYDYLRGATKGNKETTRYEINSLENAKQLGFIQPNGKPDRKAIMKWQEENGLEPNGVIGAKTKAKINLLVSRSGLTEDFQFSPEQEKWLGGANRQDPYILARMPGPKPPPEYFNNSDDQKIAQQIVKSHELADKWQQFRQGGSLLSKALRRVPGVNQAANVVDVGANVVKGDFATAGRQALGMIPAAKPLNVALQAGDVIGNVKKGDYESGLRGALGLAAGQGNETAAKAVKGLSTFDKIKNASQKISNFTNKEQTMENTCPHCGGIALDNEILAEKKDACYHKVKSRYKVWPSAYASGALVKCRKKGAKNWGKSKTNEDTNLYFNVVGTDKKTLISEFKLQHNARGWYLNENSPSSLKLDAVRAFGMPLSEEELNPIAYDGTAATIGTDNGKSPVGSIPKSQRINKRRGKV